MDINNFNRSTRSYICNIKYWMGNFKSLKNTLQKKKELKLNIKTVSDIENYMKQFVWQPELIDWDPWIITILNNNLHDDCDGSATLGKYLFGIIGINASIYHLYGSIGAHAIAVTNDHRYMVSNSNVCNIDPSDWKQSIYSYFDNKYFYIEKYLGG